MQRMTMGATEWLLLIALSVLWGGSFFFNAVALAELPTLTVVLGRVGLAALALWCLIALGAGRPTATPGLRLAFLVMGVLNNAIPFTLIVWGQTRIGSSLAAILNATTPLFTVILAHWLTLDERMTPARIAGVACGLLGVVVMIGPAALEELGLEVLAQLAVVGAAVAYACAGIFGRRFRSVPPLHTAAGQLTGSTLVMLPLVLLVDRPWELASPSAITWGAVLGLALASTALAYVIYFRILARAGATNLLLVTFLIPISAFALGAAFIGERLAPAQLGGAALVLLGLAAVDGRVLGRRAIRPRSAPAVGARTPRRGGPA